MTMLAKCSDQPRFWALPVKADEYWYRDGWQIFDRDHADKYCAHLGSDLECTWHDKGYWDITVREWAEATRRAKS
jgi:hypothetical protein